MKKAAVVILNWNGRKLLEQFLPSVVSYSTSGDWDIVVADNDSTDSSMPFLEQCYPQVKRIALAQNYGFAEGYNRALKQIDAEYFVLLNSDVEVTQDWLKPMVEYLDTHPDVAAAQPKILSQRNKSMFEYAGAAGGFIDKYGYPFCRGRIFGEVEADKGQYDTPCDIFWASGACMLIRARDYFECGGLDASFFAHMEEIDLCWRIQARGKRIVCLPASTVYHVGGATLNEDSPRKTYLNFRNNLLMLYKNLPEKKSKRVLRTRYFLDRLAAMQMMIAGKKANAQAVMAAYREFDNIKRSYRRVRDENIRCTTRYDIATIYKQSLLLKFYAEGKKVFSRILCIRSV